MTGALKVDGLSPFNGKICLSCPLYLGTLFAKLTKYVLILMVFFNSYVKAFAPNNEH